VLRRVADLESNLDPWVERGSSSARKVFLRPKDDFVYLSFLQKCRVSFWSDKRSASSIHIRSPSGYGLEIGWNTFGQLDKKLDLYAGSWPTDGRVEDMACNG